MSLTYNEIMDNIEIDEVPEDLRAIFIATLGQMMSPELADSLDPHTVDASRVRGRSASTKGLIPEVLEDSETMFPRPNGETYYARKWGEHQDVAVLRRAREIRKFALFLGEPGTGKTALAEGTFGEELLTMLGSGDTELADFIGGYVQGEKPGTFEWVDGPLVRAMIEGRPLLIDEIGVINTKALTGLYGVMDGRDELVITANPERGIVKAKEGFYICAATNPNAPGVRMSEALLSRFSLQVEVTTDFPLALRLGVPNSFVQVAQNLNKRRQTGEVSWSPQFRELLQARDLMKEFGQEFALANLVASAPESDRSVVADLFTNVFGTEVLPAQI